MFNWMRPTEAPDSRPVLDNEAKNQRGASDSFVLPDSVAWRAIRDFAGMPPLRWQTLKVNFRQQTYELHSGEEILGLMHCEVNRWSSRGLARTKEGTWSFRTPGIGSGIAVEVENDEGVRALIEPYGNSPTLVPPFGPLLSGATLSLPNGHDYFFKSWGWFTTYYRWRAADNTPLVTASVRERFMSPPTGSDVEVHPPSAALPELDLLITLGWYLRLAPPTFGGGS
jgi:hypothetical protein